MAEEQNEKKNPAVNDTAGKKINYAAIFFKWFGIGFFTSAATNAAIRILDHFILR